MPVLNLGENTSFEQERNLLMLLLPNFLPQARKTFPHFNLKNKKRTSEWHQWQL